MMLVIVWWWYYWWLVWCNCCYRWCSTSFFHTNRCTCPYIIGESPSWVPYNWHPVNHYNTQNQVERFTNKKLRAHDDKLLSWVKFLKSNQNWINKTNNKRQIIFNQNVFSQIQIYIFRVNIFKSILFSLANIFLFSILLNTHFAFKFKYIMYQIHCITIDKNLCPFDDKLIYIKTFLFLLMRSNKRKIDNVSVKCVLFILIQKWEK